MEKQFLRYKQTAIVARTETWRMDERISGKRWMDALGDEASCSGAGRNNKTKCGIG